MKNPVQLFFVVAAAVFLATACQNSKVYTVNVSGEGADFYPDSSLVLIYRDGADFRFEQPVAYAYLDKGTFSMSFQDSVTRQYEMLFESDLEDNMFQFFNLFSDRAPLHFQFSRKYDVVNTHVTGSRDNEELYLYYNKSREAHEKVDSMDYEIDLWRIGHCGDKYGWPEEGSEEEAALEAMYDRREAVYDSISNTSDYAQWRADRMRTHKTLAGLAELKDDIYYQIQLYKSDQVDSIDRSMLDLLDEYGKKYPGNDMFINTTEELAALERTRPGMPAPDFSAPALDGERYSLSELIEGRIAVLDCWASWCLSCRQHSVELIPVYEQYKDKGFTVVGVAREFESLDDMRHAIESDGYPWIQLYDLDGVEDIWNLYSLSIGGGGIFLIDSDGRIVEKVKDIASVKAYLQQHLD
jgi:peroxiredoxin